MRLGLLAEPEAANEGAKRLVHSFARFGIVGAAYGTVLSKYMMAFVFNAMFDREFMDLQLEALGLRRAVRPPSSGGTP